MSAALSNDVDDDDDAIDSRSSNTLAVAAEAGRSKINTRQSNVTIHTQEQGIVITNKLITYIQSIGGIGMIIGSIAYNEFLIHEFKQSIKSNNSTVDALFLSPNIDSTYRSYEEYIQTHIKHMIKHVSKFNSILGSNFIVKVENSTIKSIINSYIFPGLLIKVYNKLDILLAEISYEVSCKIDINSFQLHAVNPNNNYVNWVGWIIVSFFSINADDKYKSVFDSFIRLLDMKSNSSYKYASTLLIIVQNVFRNSSILEYRYKSDHLLQYILLLLNNQLTISNQSSPDTHLTYEQFVNSVEDKVLEYGYMNIPHSMTTQSTLQQITLRQLINHCIYVMSLLISPYAKISKSGGEVYRYYGNYGKDTKTKDIDTKVFFMPGISEENKIIVYQNIITVALIYVSIISHFNFMTSYINVMTSNNHINITGNIFGEAFRLDLQPFTTQSAAADEDHQRDQRDVSLRSIKISGIKLLSIDLIAKTTFTFLETRSQIYGKIISSPLDIAFDKYAFDPTNVVLTRQNINILTPQYLIKDITKIMKDPSRKTKNSKDVARRDFISHKSNQQINEDMSIKLNDGIQVDIFNKNIASPPFAHIHVDPIYRSTYDNLHNYYSEILDSLMSSTNRFKTPLYYSVNPDETNNETEIYSGGGKKSKCKHKNTKCKHKNTKCKHKNTKCKHKNTNRKHKNTNRKHKNTQRKHKIQSVKLIKH
jgi:hypothetical protein